MHNRRSKTCLLASRQFWKTKAAHLRSFDLHDLAYFFRGRCHQITDGMNDVHSVAVTCTRTNRGHVSHDLLNSARNGAMSAFHLHPLKIRARIELESRKNGPASKLVLHIAFAKAAIIEHGGPAH